MPNEFNTPSTILLPTVRPHKPSENETAGLEWIGLPVSFDVAEEVTVITGFQMYAVEKWIVERMRPITALVVQTGDSEHKITMTALRPSHSLSSGEAKAQWDAALIHLRRDGARPTMTPAGVVLSTSLAHFRSDYTIVHIPDGNFLAVQSQLFSNINLLRMGCTGIRGGVVGLDEPSEATKDRFLTMYHLPEMATVPKPSLLSDRNLVEASSAVLSGKLKERRDERTRKSMDSNLLVSPPIISPANSSGSGRSSGQFTPLIGQPNSAGVSPTQTQQSSPRFSDGDPLPVQRTKSSPVFSLTVLEVGKLIQTGLAISGLFNAPAQPSSPSAATSSKGAHPDLLSRVAASTSSVRLRSSSIDDPASATKGLHTSNWWLEQDGLLCDVTVEGIKAWIDEIGRPVMSLEPMERIADPQFLSALLSLVLSTRNKLSALGYNHIVPKDPFMHPHAFNYALTLFLQSLVVQPNRYEKAHSNNASPLPSPHPYAANASATSINSSISYFPHTPTFSSHSHTPSSLLTAQPSLPVPPLHEPLTSLGLPIQLTSSSQPNLPQYLNRSLIESLNSSYSRHTSPGDAPAAARKVRRAILDKLDTVQRRGGGDTLNSGDEDHGPGDVSNLAEQAQLQLRNGIGNLASGFGLGNIGSNRSGKAQDILEVQLVLEVLVKGIVGKDKGVKFRERIVKKRRRGSAVGKGPSDSDMGTPSPVDERDIKEHERDTAIVLGVGGCIRGLWSGRCGNVVMLRQREAVRGVNFGGTKHHGTEGRKIQKTRPKKKLYASDGELADGSDGRSSDAEDLIGGFAPWSGKVQKKFESWTRRRKGQNSLDLTSSPSRSKTSLAFSTSLSTEKENGFRQRAKQDEAARPPVINIASDDDDASGVERHSPIDLLTPRPPQMTEAHTPSSRTSDLGLGLPRSSHDHKVLSASGQKRPWANRITQARVSSWSDPVSARDVISPETLDREDSKASPAKNSSSPLSILDYAVDALSDEPEDMLLGASLSPIRRPQKPETFATRRRSFHDLSLVRDVRVLSVERMKIDVDLCGQYLVMSRRASHLRNVMTCLRILTGSLPSSNAFLKSDYESNAEKYSETKRRTKVLADIDLEHTKATATEQATKILNYESAQFDVANLWHTASPSRQRVFAMREMVYGTGGRRLPAGVHGAYGPYNRLQYTLDGRERLVDSLGRTESEAEAESDVDPLHEFAQGELEEEEDVTIVKHRAIKPVWLLGWFKNFGARWTGSSATRTKPEPQKAEGPAESDSKGE